MVATTFTYFPITTSTDQSPSTTPIPIDTFDGRAANYRNTYAFEYTYDIDKYGLLYDADTGRVLSDTLGFNQTIFAAAVAPFALIAIALLIHRLVFEIRRGYWTPARAWATILSATSGLMLGAGFLIGIVEDGQYSLFSHILSHTSAYLAKSSLLLTLTTLTGLSPPRFLRPIIFFLLTATLLSALATILSSLFFCKPIATTYSFPSPECLPYLATSQLALYTVLPTITTLAVLLLSGLTLRLSPRPALPLSHLLCVSGLFAIAFCTIPVMLIPVLSNPYPAHAGYSLISGAILLSCICAPSLRGAWVVMRQRRREMEGLEAGIVCEVGREREEEEMVGELEKMRRRVKELEGRVEERLKERERKRGKVELVGGKEDEESGVFS